MTQNNSLNKSVIIQQEKFIESVVGLGDILVTQTENKKNSEVIPTLGELRKLLEQLLSLRESNPERFDQLMLDKDYWKYLDDDKKDAQLRLSFNPEKYLRTFNFLLQQVIRVFEAAVKAENEEIIRHASYELVFFLEQVASIEKADLLVKEILKKLWEFSRKSIAIKSIAAHSTTYHWYSDIVFDNLRQTKNGFKYEYLPIFNRYFFENIKYLISHDEFDIFGQLIGHLIDGVHIPDYELHDIWNYDDFLAQQDRDLYIQVSEDSNVNEKLRKLNDDGKTLYSQEKLDEWLKQFELLKSAIYPHLNRSNKIKATKLEKRLKKAVYKLLASQTLVQVIFFSGAWAVYKSKPEFIKEIWTHKQPEDAGASYGGNDIFPQNLNELVHFYFNLSVRDSLGFFWEDHHDSEKYVQTYFLLLLMKYLKPLQPYAELQPQPSTEPKKYPEIADFTLPFEEPTELSNIKFIAEGLLVTAEELKTTNLVRDLELTESTEETSELVGEKLIPFLKRIIENSQEKIKKLKKEEALSEEKISEFKSELVDSYRKMSTLPKLFQELGHIENNVSNMQLVDKPLMGYHQLERREMFFENWHVDFGDFSKHFGRGLAESIDSHLVKKITETLEITEEEEIFTLINSYTVTNKTVIFTSHDYVFEHLEFNENFIPFWKETTRQEKEPYFQGWLITQERRIKVYSFNLSQHKMYYAIFDIDTVGTLVQYYPLLEGDSDSDLIDIIRVKIKDFATTETLVNEFLDSPPAWLQRVGNRDEQKEHLLQYVILQIGIKFEFIPSENSVGFLYSSE